MSNAKKCDICGQFYEGSTENYFVTTIKFGYYTENYG